jgi:hypothetical protein
LKISDGVYPYNVLDGGRKLERLVSKLKEKGVQVWGYQYIYGYNPVIEGEVGAKRANELGLYGFVIDAETEYNHLNMARKASSYMDSLKKSLDPKMLVALSSFRYPWKYQRDFPWKEFLSKCDLYAPQVYWLQSHGDAHIQLRNSLSNCRLMFEKNDIDPNMPIRPTGASFQQNGWEPTLDEIKAFHEEAQALGVFAIDWWEAGNMSKYVKHAYNYIYSHPYNSNEIPEPPPNEKFVKVNAYKLNMRNAPRVSSATFVGHTYYDKKLEVIEDVNDKWLKVATYVHKSWVEEI